MRYTLLRCRCCNYTVIGSESNCHEDMINHVEQSHGFNLHKIAPIRQFNIKGFYKTKDVYQRKLMGLKMLIKAYRDNPKNYAIRILQKNIDNEFYKLLKNTSKKERNKILLNTIKTPAKVL